MKSISTLVSPNHPTAFSYIYKKKIVNWFQTKEYIKYRLKSGHWKGFGIHSPFIFEFVNLVLREKRQYYVFPKIEAWRESLCKSQVVIEVNDWGAGSKVSNSSQRSISKIARHAALPKKYGELLFRMLERYKRRNILELGTSLGISTLYLALPNSNSRVITLEGSSTLSEFATRTFHEMNANNVELVQGHFDNTLLKSIKKLPSLDLVFFDGNHRKEPTLSYFHRCLKNINNNSIFVFDDIHWSKEMNQAWKEIIQHPKVTVSIDIFRLGIVFFRKESDKQHFTIHF